MYPIKVYSRGASPINYDMGDWYMQLNIVSREKYIDKVSKAFEKFKLPTVEFPIDVTVCSDLEFEFTSHFDITEFLRRLQV